MLNDAPPFVGSAVRYGSRLISTLAMTCPMKVSGFTFVRNVVKYDYPVVESIRSILPIVDEFIVNVGRCDDGTLELIRSIGDPKIRIVESVWDETLQKDGLIYAQQTNIALAHCTGDWAFYIQADEVVHEDDLPIIQDAMRRHLGNPEVKGLVFRYLHFIADYWSTNPWFYHKAVRIIRNNGEVESCGDAVGFHLKATQQYLQSGPKEWIAAIERASVSLRVGEGPQNDAGEGERADCGLPWCHAASEAGSVVPAEHISL